MSEVPLQLSLSESDLAMTSIYGRTPVRVPQNQGLQQFTASPDLVRKRYRGTSIIRNCLLLGPYSSPRPRDLW